MLNELSGNDPTCIDLHSDPLTQRLTGYSNHGGFWIDVPYMTELVPGFWFGGCESGLVLPDYIKHIVSLYPWKSYDIRHDISSALAVTMYDSNDQAAGQVPAIAAWVNECRKTGPVLVHCQAGLNRSSLVACSALMLNGLTADEAIVLVREKRSPVCLCNPAFERWLREWRPLSQLREIEIICQRVYTKGGRRVHLRVPGMKKVLCNASPAHDVWLGIGNQQERDRASELSVCLACRKRAGGKGD